MISPSLVDQLTHKQDKDWLTQPMLTTSSSSDLIKQRLIKSRNFYHQCLKSVIASLTRTSIQRAQTTKFRKNANMQYHTTAWKVSKSGVFSGPYFPVFGPEQNLFLDTFHAVYLTHIPDINWRNPLLRMNFLDTWKMFHELTLTEKIKLRTFTSHIELIFLHDSELCTLTGRLDGQITVFFTRKPFFARTMMLKIRLRFS